MPLGALFSDLLFSWEKLQYRPFLTHVKKISVSGQTSRFLMLGNACLSLEGFCFFNSLAWSFPPPVASGKGSFALGSLFFKSSMSLVAVTLCLKFVREQDK